MVRSGVMELNFDDIWVKVQELLKPALNPVSFNTWFQDPKIHNITEDKVTLIVPMPMFKRMFESTYKELLTNSFAEILGEEKGIECVLEEE
jgi:chromosomal replication initiation ATPase DnaA